jgi:hypothetical protein
MDPAEAARMRDLSPPAGRWVLCSDVGAIEMTQQYLIGELSMRLEQLAAAARKPAAGDVARACAIRWNSGR